VAGKDAESNSKWVNEGKLTHPKISRAECVKTKETEEKEKHIGDLESVSEYRQKPGKKEKTRKRENAKISRWAKTKREEAIGSGREDDGSREHGEIREGERTQRSSKNEGRRRSGH